MASVSLCKVAAQQMSRARLSALIVPVLLLAAGSARAPAAGDAHPRIWLTPAAKAQLLAKVRANDPTWVALKKQADQLAGYSIYPYHTGSRTNEPDNTIFYDYEGSGWWSAAVPLGLAWQLTGDTKYADKLVQLADEMIAAQSRPDNQPPDGELPLQVDDYYPSRYLGPTLALIYDWAYDRLGADRRARMVDLMNAYFDDMRANAYEVNDHADGNYLVGHLAAGAWMGYASLGNNPRAQQMIDWARMRFDGTQSALVADSDVPTSNVAQVFDGGYQSAAGVPGAPFRSGFDFQGWSYGTGTFDRLLDYMLVVKTAGGEDLAAGHRAWLGAILRAEKEALQPDRFQIDPRGEWGGDYGAVIDRSLPLRLAYLLQGTPDGPYAEHFAYSEVDPKLCASVPTCNPEPWVDFFFGDPKRPSTALTLPPYYSGYAPGNGAMPYFIMRSGFGTSDVWASAYMGAAWYDDHQHEDAGHIMIRRGSDFLLVSSGDFKGDLGSKGYLGSSNEDGSAAAGNTLYFNDFGDSQCADESQYDGGQGVWGSDAVVAAEQTAAGTYVRSDLSSAYDTGDAGGCYLSRLQDLRELDSFYRSFVYVPQGNLFVVFDQAKAKPSTSPHGRYLMHLRWHFPNVPKLQGKQVTVTQGASRLVLSTVLPSNAALSAVDERHNPDGNDCSGTPCTICERGIDGVSNACQPFGDAVNAGTERVEVRTPGNPLAQEFLTAMQAGPKTLKPMKTALVTAADGSMKGVQMTPAGGKATVVLFNAGPGAAPTPIGSVSYTAGKGQQILLGMKPGARYGATRSGATVTVTESGSGAYTASSAGVLRFAL